MCIASCLVCSNMDRPDQTTAQLPNVSIATAIADCAKSILLNAKKIHIDSPFATEVTGLLSSQNFHPTEKLAAQMKQLLATFHEQTPLKTSTTQHQASNYNSYQRMASMQISGTRLCKHYVSRPSQQITSARLRSIPEHNCTFAAFKRSLFCRDAGISSHVNLFDDKFVYATNK